jgi:flagellar FliL protein
MYKRTMSNQKNTPAHNLSIHRPAIRLLSAFVWVWLMTSTGLSTSYANEEQGAAGEKVQYVNIKPAITTNFLSEKLQYVQADVALKVRGEASATAVREHTPRIKHSLILLLARQEAESVTSPEGRATIRQIALEEINAMMAEEGLKTSVEEVLFTRFIVE